MADFFQNGVITTLHRLGNNSNLYLESELERLSRQMPIALILPSLYSEFEGPAMPAIINELAKVRYLKRIVVALDKATLEEYQRVCSLFDGFPTEVTVIWNNGESIQSLIQLLEAHNLQTGVPGKGRSCWMAMGYLLALNDCEIYALHDCDILTYDSNMLARLCYPVANPAFGFWFCKGYYARVSHQMHGRATRLFLTPLIRALNGLIPDTGFLPFLDSFRYPLAGEFALNTFLARTIRIPSDWGLEVGVLAEVYRNSSIARVCQVDLSDQYDHKHQGLSEDDPSQGLRRMTREVSKSLFRTLAGEGAVMGRDFFRALQIRYIRCAEDAISRYYADAMLNGLEFERHIEEKAVEVFSQSVREGGVEYLKHALPNSLIPNWNRVISAIPDFFERICQAVHSNRVFHLQAVR
jgi:glucosyl-3-phosphoglycerate synthase